MVTFIMDQIQSEVTNQSDETTASLEFDEDQHTSERAIVACLLLPWQEVIKEEITD